MAMTQFKAHRVDAADFKASMRQLAAGVNIITTLVDGEPHGLVATAVCSVTLDPPTLLICVNRTSRTHNAIAQSGSFCVNVLQHDQGHIARNFLNPERAARFRNGQRGRMVTGAPALDGCLVNCDCEIVQQAQAGTHTVFFGRVVANRVNSGDSPLLYFDGNYATLASRCAVA
jgi:flavin reductase